jgi:hypothetical protein
MFLGPHDRWPRHSRPQARAALEEAREAGWWLRPSDGHNFGRLRCMPTDLDPYNEACKVPIFSTSGAEDGSDTARVIRDALRRCTHTRRHSKGESVDPESAAHCVGGELADVERLIDAADALYAKERALEEAGRIVDTALGRLEDDAGTDTREADRLASGLDRLASIQEGRALAAALTAGAGEPWPPGDGARELTGLARARLAQADDHLVMAIGSHEEHKLRSERERVAIRLERLVRPRTSD